MEAELATTAGDEHKKKKGNKRAVVGERREQGKSGRVFGSPPPPPREVIPCLQSHGGRRHGRPGLTVHRTDRLDGGHGAR